MMDADLELHCSYKLGPFESKLFQKDLRFASWKPDESAQDIAQTVNYKNLTDEDVVKAIIDYGGFVKYDDYGNVQQINLVYNDDNGKYVQCTNRSDSLSVYFPKLAGVTELLLSESQATDYAMHYIGKMKHLKKIYLWDAYVSDEGIACLSDLESLEYIHVTKAGLTDKSMETFGKLTNLEGLSLQSNDFTDKGLSYIKKLTKLKNLFIGLGSDITDKGLNHLLSLKSIEKIGLQQCVITDDGIQRLITLPKLKKLIIYETPITQEGITEFKKHRPDVEFAL